MRVSTVNGILAAPAGFVTSARWTKPIIILYLLQSPFHTMPVPNLDGFQLRERRENTVRRRAIPCVRSDAHLLIIEDTMRWYPISEFFDSKSIQFRFASEDVVVFRYTVSEDTLLFRPHWRTSDREVVMEHSTVQGANHAPLKSITHLRQRV